MTATSQNAPEADRAVHPVTRGDHARAIMLLGLPLIGSHLAQTSIWLTDSVMLGWYDVEALAAQVLGSMYWFILFVFGSGFSSAVMPMVAEAEAAGETTQVRRVTRMAIWLTLGYSALTMPLMLGAETVLGWLGQDTGLAADAGAYLAVAGWSIFPALLVMVLKSYLAALERTRVVLLATLAAVVVNAAANWALIFGNWGAPEMGIVGAAWASVASQIASAMVVIVYVILVTPQHSIFVRFWRPDPDALRRVFRLGWPIGVTSVAEVGLFSAASLMMGWLGTIPLAAHGIALQISSMTFMMHVGLSNVATVRAGRAMGRGDLAELKRGAQVVVAMSMVFAVLTMLVFITIPHLMVGAFLSPDDPDRAAVIAIGVVLMAAAALFQLADAAQVMALGLLRGLQDTRVPAIIATVAYWLVGAPLAYILGFPLGLEGVGIWLGLAAGLAVAGGFMMLRFWRTALPRLRTHG
jgi:MATE family multidrug resistance protein